MKRLVKCILWAVFFNAGAALAHLEVSWSLILFVIAMMLIDDLLDFAIPARVTK